MSHPHPLALDRLLYALRSTGPDSYRADPDVDGKWHSFCPACGSHLAGTRRLTILEGRDGRVRLYCTTQCSEESILRALKARELLYETAPALTAWGLDAPALELPLIDAECDRRAAATRLLRTLERELVAA